MKASNFYFIKTKKSTYFMLVLAIQPQRYINKIESAIDVYTAGGGMKPKISCFFVT
jgi:hypothetical protein